MIVFPNAKINIGLNILSKRDDGFHNLQSVFYPIKLRDIIEFKVNSEQKFNLTGIQLKNSDTNLVLRAYNILSKQYKLPPLKIHLHKLIPIEAGLGGGSANATYMLIALNKYFNLNISKTKLLKYADKIGSDCSFFIDNKPSYVTGKGDNHKYLPNFLKAKFIVVIKSGISISTKDAFKNVSINKTSADLLKILELPVNKWKHLVINDFEKYIFSLHPELAEIKQYLYNNGAEYASMSGSGSAIYGIFNTNPNIIEYKNYFVWNEIID